MYQIFHPLTAYLNLSNLILMDTQGFLLAQSAISAALEQKWQDAISINLNILEDNPVDIEALNRLARAYLELDNPSAAQKTYQKVLELDPYNQIAIRNLQKLLKANGNGQRNGNGSASFSQSLDIFLAEPGKTKMVSVIKLTTPACLSYQREGQAVTIFAKKHCVAIASLSGEYLGVLPDDLSHLLISLMDQGNRYEAFIKSVTPKSLIVLVREVYRSKKLLEQPSFVELYKRSYQTIPTREAKRILSPEEDDTAQEDELV